MRGGDGKAGIGRTLSRSKSRSSRKASALPSYAAAAHRSAPLAEINHDVTSTTLSKHDETGGVRLLRHLVKVSLVLLSICTVAWLVFGPHSLDLLQAKTAALRGAAGGADDIHGKGTSPLKQSVNDSSESEGEVDSVPLPLTHQQQPRVESRKEDWTLVGTSHMSDASKAAIMSMFHEKQPMKSIRDLALAGSVFPENSLEFHMLKATTYENAGPTPIIDLLLDSGRIGSVMSDAVRTLRYSILHAPIALIGEDGAIEPANEENRVKGCGGYLPTVCQIIQPVCLLTSTATLIVEPEEMCVCAAMHPECQMCSASCGWAHCSSSEFHPVLNHSKDGRPCPPEMYAADLDGTYKGLKNKKAPGES